MRSSKRIWPKLRRDWRPESQLEFPRRALPPVTRPLAAAIMIRKAGGCIRSVCGTLVEPLAVGALLPSELAVAVPPAEVEGVVAEDVEAEVVEEDKN